MTPTSFTPHKGLLSVGRKLAERFGALDLWDGDEGLGAVASDLLKQAGLSDKPVSLVAPTPLKMAEQAGLVKPRRRKPKAKRPDVFDVRTGEEINMATGRPYTKQRAK